MKVDADSWETLWKAQGRGRNVLRASRGKDKRLLVYTALALLHQGLHLAAWDKKLNCGILTLFFFTSQVNESGGLQLFTDATSSCSTILIVTIWLLCHRCHVCIPARKEGMGKRQKAWPGEDCSSLSEAKKKKKEKKHLSQKPHLIE